MRVERWSEPTLPDAAALRRRLEAEGYGVYSWSDPPGAEYPPHTHATDQSHWVLAGSLALTVGGQEYVLRPGDRDWLPANTSHSARVVGSEPVVYLIGEQRAR